MQDLVSKLMAFDCKDGDVEAFFEDIRKTMEGNLDIPSHNPLRIENSPDWQEDDEIMKREANISAIQQSLQMNNRWSER